MTERRLVGAAVAAFAGGFAALAVLQHRAFETGRFDVGNLVQAVWSTAHGDFLEVTGLTGLQISRLGAHFDPIVATLTPLWWIWPDASLLLVVQAIAVSLGAVPVYLLARARLDSAWAGLGFALVYLLYPPTQWLVLDDFHPVAFATPLLLAAIWFLERDRLAGFALAAALACLTKEHIGLVVAGLGLWYAISRGRWRVGLAVAALGTAVAVVAVAFVVPHFAPGGGSPFGSRYADVGGSPAAIAKTAITNPGRIAAEATEGRDLGYVLDLLAPLAGLPLLAPGTLLTAAPEVLVNVLSSTRTQTSIHFHYTAGAIPGLAFAAILGAARLKRRWPRVEVVLPRLAVLAALAGGAAYGPIPLWAHVPFGEQLGGRDHVVYARDDAAARAIAAIPAAAPVSATNTLGAHLSERSRVFSFPLVREARWVAVDTGHFSYLDDAVAPVRGRRAYEAMLADGSWRVVFDELGIVVLRRS